jgi:hypothetical protein
MPKYLLTLDQGTTSSRALVIDHSGKVISVRPVTGRLTGIPNRRDCRRSASGAFRPDVQFQEMRSRFLKKTVRFQKSVLGPSPENHQQP